jgi:hypothetical protein
VAEGRLKRCPHCREPKPLDAFGLRKQYASQFTRYLAGDKIGSDVTP